jgi:serine/threonine protein kinase
LEFPEKRWQSVSAQAKQLLRGLLNVDPKKRMKLKDLARHEWIRNGGCCSGASTTTTTTTTTSNISCVNGVCSAGSLVGTSNGTSLKMGHAKKGSNCSQDIVIDLCEPSPAAALHNNLIDGEKDREIDFKSLLKKIDETSRKNRKKKFFIC